ncbi:dipeptidase [Sphingomonas sp. TX0543]|uniref:dipeptidase n=1 Tax=unclassified Sphingomonas TaxID=196159 RepID=UPI0010F8D977|nr:membrane dipeptidase [Sphingomonas sp. 3P27F8]
MQTFGRRSMLAGMMALPALRAAARSPAAAPSPADRLYRQAIVLNGNLAGPFSDTKPLPARDAKEIRQSGITAFKTTLGGSGSNRADTIEEIAFFDAAIAANRDLFVKVRDVGDIAAAKRAGRVGIIYSFEGASMLEGKIEAIDAFRASGVLVMGLSYNVTTPFASGVLSRQSTGLTELGRQAVARMNAQGVTIDVSHSDEPSSLAAIAASRRPTLVTHAGCGAVHPHPRNKSDALIRALANSGGVIGIYELSFIAGGRKQQSLDDYLAHLTHALKVAGEDHVGIGSDALVGRFDTSPANMKMWNADIARRKASGVGAPGEGPPPFVEGLNRADRMEVIARALAKRGVRSAAIEKILGTNFQRVFAETWTAG